MITEEKQIMSYSKKKKEILNSSLFDQNWYKENFMKNDPSHLSPIDHFLSIGTFFDYPPSPFFSCYIYRLITNLDIHENCLIDYLYRFQEGKGDFFLLKKEIKSKREFYNFLKKREIEVRKIRRDNAYISLKRNKSFLDEIKYIFSLKKNSGQKLYKLPIQLSYNYELIFRSDYFDEVFYSKTYCLDQVDPIVHYLEHADVETIFSHNFSAQDYYHHVKKIPGFQELPTLLKTKLLLHYEIFKNQQKLINGIFPKSAEKVEFKKENESKIIHRRACIFAMYSGDGKISDETVYLLKSIKNFVDRIYVVSDSPLIPVEINKIKPYISFGLFNKHGLYDFGSYKLAFNELRTYEDLTNFDTILIANDSILGPTKPLSDFFYAYKQEGEPDLYGITINNFGYKDNLSPGFSLWSPHIQSYFILISKRFFESDTWTSFINQIQKKENKIDIIIDYEMGLTKLALKNGFTIGSYYKSKALNNPAASESASILENAFFLKKSLLKNKTNEKLYNFILEKNKFPFSIKNGTVHLNSKSTYSNSSKINCAEIYSILKTDESQYLINIKNFSGDKVKLVSITGKFINIISPFLKNTLTSSIEKEICSNQEKFESFKFNLDPNASTNKLFLLNKDSYIPLQYFLLKINFNDLDNDYLTCLKNGIIHINKSKLMHFFRSSFKFKELLKAFIALFSPKKYILFGEKGNMRSDNSWELFSYSLNNPSINKYCYFVTDKEIIYKEKNRFIRNHLIERYSRRHLLYFLQAKALIFSFDLYSLLPNLDQNIQSILRKKIKTVLLSHGFSAGQVNSVLISPFFSNNKDFVAISSPLEREYLTSIGYEDNKLVACGYPRMDKWSKFSISSTRTVTIAFTWRRDLISKNIDDFIRSFYFQNSMKILQRVNDLISPNGSIYFIIHNAFPKHLVIAMTGYILGHFPNVIVSSSEDDRLNEALTNSSDLVTDVSSIGIDFSKKSNCKAFFLLDQKFLGTHYQINFDIFLKISSLAQNISISKTTEELLDAFSNFKGSKNFSNKLFYNSKEENCKETFEEILTKIL